MCIETIFCRICILVDARIRYVEVALKAARSDQLVYPVLEVTSLSNTDKLRHRNEFMV